MNNTAYVTESVITASQAEQSTYSQVTQTLAQNTIGSLQINGAIIDPVIQIIIFITGYLLAALIHEIGHLIVFKGHDKNARIIINPKKFELYTKARVDNNVLKYSAFNGILIGYLVATVFAVFFLSFGGYFHAFMIIASYLLGCRKDFKLLKRIKNESGNIS